MHYTYGTGGCIFLDSRFRLSRVRDSVRRRNLPEGREVPLERYLLFWPPSLVGRVRALVGVAFNFHSFHFHWTS